MQLCRSNPIICGEWAGGFEVVQSCRGRENFPALALGRKLTVEGLPHPSVRVETSLIEQICAKTEMFERCRKRKKGNGKLNGKISILRTSYICS